MNVEKFVKKISKISDRYSDPDFKLSSRKTVVIPTFYEDLSRDLSKLCHFAYKGGKSGNSVNNLSADDLVEVLNSAKDIDEIVNHFKKFKRLKEQYDKFRPHLEQSLEAKEILLDTIKRNNSILIPLEVATVEKIIQEMEVTEKEEEKNFVYLENIVKSGNENFTPSFINSDDKYLLCNNLNRIQALYYKVKKITTPEKNNELLSRVENQATELYTSVTLKIIDHYETLKQIDSQLNKDHLLIGDFNVDAFKTQLQNDLSPEKEEDDDEYEYEDY